MSIRGSKSKPSKIERKSGERNKFEFDRNVKKKRFVFMFLSVTVKFCLQVV